MRRAARASAAAALVLGAAGLSGATPDGGDYGGGADDPGGRDGGAEPLPGPYFPTGNYLPGGEFFPGAEAAGTCSADSPLAIDLFLAPAILHVEAPPGTAVALDLRRTGGSLPEVLAVADADGRVFAPAAVRRVSGRAEYAEIPVRGDGGLDVLVAPVRTLRAAGTVTVSVRELLPEERLPAERPTWVPGRFVLGGGNGTDPAVVAELLGGQLDGAWGDAFAVACDPSRAGLEWSDAEDYRCLLGPDWWIELDPFAEPPEGSQSNQLIVASELGRSYPRQIAFRMVAAPPFPRPPEGVGVTIAVLDTGVDATHPAFRGRVLPGIDLVDGDEDASEEHAEADGDSDGRVDESFGHGTVVAGVALGIAPGARILPVRVLDADGRGTATRVAEGIRWAVEHGADVINLSLGMRAWSSVLDEAVREAVDARVIVVVAAGNDGDRYSVDFPADVPGVIAATALGAGGRRAWYGNGRRATTVLAPGSRVIGPYPGGTWAMGTGTSFAAPIVAGAAARWRQADPTGDTRAFQARLAPRSRLDLRPLWR